jgi:hypothetical protein
MLRRTRSMALRMPMAGFLGETGDHPRSSAYLTRAAFAPPAFSGHQLLAHAVIAASRVAA